MRYFPFDEPIGPEVAELSKEFCSRALTVGQVFTALRGIHPPSAGEFLPCLRSALADAKGNATPVAKGMAVAAKSPARAKAGKAPPAKRGSVTAGTGKARGPSPARRGRSGSPSSRRSGSPS